MNIIPVTPLQFDAWVKMRCALWPEYSEPELRASAGAMLANSSGDFLVLIASDNGRPMGFAEAAVRRDYVNGCETSPVVFLEGIYVAEPHRKSGVARALVADVAAWGKEKECKEFASDALLENADSHRMHKALGFKETERVVYFRKKL